jgi:CheY-like chemotaxis protein
MAKRLLLVDDEPDFVDVVSAWLAFKGYKVDTAKDGQEALVKLRKGSYDLVLLDLMMPRLDGYEFCRQIREDEALKEVPVLILSAVPRMNGLRRPGALGADGYLEKLATHEEIACEVEKILRSKGLWDGHDSLDSLS